MTNAAAAFWSIEEVAAFLGVSVATVYGWRHRGIGPPSFRINGVVLHSPDEVQSWVEASREEARSS